MRRFVTGLGYVAGWLVAFLASSGATYMLSFLINPYGPSCRGGGPNHIPVMNLWTVPLVGFISATALMLLWWILAAPSGRRLRRVLLSVVLAAISVPAGLMFSAFVTPLCM